jgi:hypothetical protein
MNNIQFVTNFAGSTFVIEIASSTVVNEHILI